MTRRDSQLEYHPEIVLEGVLDEGFSKNNALVLPLCTA